MITDMHTNVTQLHPKARLPGPDMEASLRKAFERGEFTLIYQFADERNRRLRSAAALR
jgi:hypothetical protein